MTQPTEDVKTIGTDESEEKQREGMRKESK
jgi:hypothetical protein